MFSYDAYTGYRWSRHDQRITIVLGMEVLGFRRYKAALGTRSGVHYSKEWTGGQSGQYFHMRIFVLLHYLFD